MTVNGFRVVAVMAAILPILAACGGDKPVSRSCNEHTVYKNAREHERVQVPDGLSPLSPDEEMVLPEPSPQASRATDAPCLDLPPSVLDSEEGDDTDDADADDTSTDEDEQGG
jgi:uncharacterized lipoprotein